MPYATKEDIDDLYGEDLLVRLADLDKDGVPDADVVEKALRGADEVCDAFLSAQYTVPVVPTPGVVRSCAIDIAVYKIALGVTTRTTEMRQRYEDAIELLKMIASGKVGLGQPPVDPDGPGGPTAPTDPSAKRKGRVFDTARG
jgi:phage gp36-like protein